MLVAVDYLQIMVPGLSAGIVLKSAREGLSRCIIVERESHDEERVLCRKLKYQKHSLRSTLSRV